MSKSPHSLFLISMLTLVIASCSPLVKYEGPARVEYSQLKEGNAFGQSFLARYRGLMGVAIYLKSSGEPRGKATLHLRTASNASTDLAEADLYLDEVSTPGYYPFTFPPQEKSANQDYYLSLETSDINNVSVGIAPAENYLYGSFYQNGKPQEAQLAFKLIYDPFQAIIGVLQLLPLWLGLLVVAAFLLLLPGWALLSATLSSWKNAHWGEKVGLAIGTSLAIYPVLFLWTDLVGLHLGPGYAWLPGLAGVTSLVWRNRSRLFAFRVRTGDIRTWLSLREPRGDIALLAVIALIFATRFWVIRNLDAPLWGDSYQHTVIAQLLTENGGLFTFWQPYAELSTFTYHFGFHTLVANIAWISGQSTPLAVLWSGQVLNALAALCLFPLAIRLGRNPWSGLAAVMLAGLLLPMPMEYTNWGRYTQLAGQVILPVALYLLWHLLEQDRASFRLVALVSLLLSGLALTHYRVAIFALCFLPAPFLVYSKRLGLSAVLKRNLWLAGGSGILFLPWFIRLFSGKILTIFGGQLSTPAEAVSEWTRQYNAIGDLFTYLPPWAWLLMVVLSGWGLWRKNTGVLLVGAWYILLIWAANPRWLGLPGEGALSNFAVFIAAYIPASLLIGAALGWLLELSGASIEERTRAAGFTRRWIFPTLSLVVIAFGFWGARQRVSDIDPETHALFTRPDKRAISWIQTTLPEEAVFLVNAFPAYNDTLVVGSDAGWWLPIMAGRKTTLPPINYGSEQGPHQNYRQWVNALTTAINNQGLDNPDILKMLHERGVTHVYIGQRQGRVNNGGPVLEPKIMLESPFFKPVYHQDRVWIFQLDFPAETSSQ